MGQTSSQPSVPSNSSQKAIPAGCPMHAQNSTPPPPPASTASSVGQCPVPHSSPKASEDTSIRPAACPLGHGGSKTSSSETAVNSSNQMPVLSQNAAPGQNMLLPTDRTLSSIPRGNDEGGGVWEYPSPQQFHNALLRKGMETKEEDVDMMVQIHNFLNERAWDEVLRWEKRFDDSGAVELARFKGRPGELSPKARFWLFAGWLLPTRFNSDPPFDRHDWIVKRRSTGEEVRYVIDYYSAPPEPDGSPCFSLDVRPALDSLGSVKARVAVATEEAWSTWKENQNARPGQGQR